MKGIMKKIILFLSFLSLGMSEIHCNYCSKSIIDKYIIQNTKYFHEKCFRENIIPKCNYCLKSLKNKYISFESKNYHENCYENNIIPKCDICNYPLKGMYNIDSWGNQYHDKHKNNPGLCSSCS